jgi:hypothetical protein
MFPVISRLPSPLPVRFIALHFLVLCHRAPPFET